MDRRKMYRAIVVATLALSSFLSGWIVGFGPREVYWSVCDRVFKKVSLPAAPTLPQKRKIAEALHLSKDGQYREALELLGDSDDEAVMYLRVKILNEAGQYEEAIACARHFCTQYPEGQRLESVLLNLAYNLGVRKRRFDEAIQCYQHLLQKFPETSRRAGIMLAMGDCLVGLDDLEEARSYYLMVPGYTREKNLLETADYSIARTYIREERFREALPWLEQASRYEGRLNEAILRDLGDARLKVGDEK